MLAWHLICIPLKEGLEPGTWMQLFWEVNPGSRSEGQENGGKEGGKDSNGCVPELVFLLGTLGQFIPEFCLQSTGVWRFIYILSFPII